MLFISIAPIIYWNFSSLKEFDVELSLEDDDNVWYYTPSADYIEQIKIFPNKSIMMPNGTIHNDRVILQRNHISRGFLIQAENRDDFLECLNCFSAITPENENGTL